MNSQEDLLVSFRGITGEDVATASRFLSGANGNLELALSNYFDTNPAPPANFKPAPVVRPPRPPSPPPDDGELPVIAELKSGSTVIPLKAIRVVLTVNQYVAQVQVLHRFVNKEPRPIEAIFSFQQENVSIYEFYAEIGGKRIMSVIKEKQAAFNAYDDAISSGGGGYLLDKESEDKFKLNVGNLPPNAECVISIKYATVLSMEGEALKVSVPITRVALREHEDSISSSSDERFPNGLTLSASIQMPSPIAGIESESHNIKSEVNRMTATLSLKGNPLDQPTRELTFLVGLQDPHKTASSVVETLNDSTALMLNFYPKYVLGKAIGEAGGGRGRQGETMERSERLLTKFTNRIENVGDEVLMEYVFLVDRSGSMAGSKITQLINALQLFLRSIPLGSLFNIVGFGSSYEQLFPSSVVYDDDSFASATRHAAGIGANLMGTQLLPPLQAILTKATHPKFPRQIFILTDGEVNNTEDVIAMTKKNIGTTRIFTLGIGSDASKRLVKGLAKAGKGQAELVESGTRMEPKVLAQLKRAMQPHLAVEIDWGTMAAEVKQGPTTIPPAFPGEPIVVFGLLNRDITPAEIGNIALKLVSPNGEVQRVPVTINSSSSEGAMIGVLAASSIISGVEKQIDEKLMSESEGKKTIIPLALKYSLVTKYTSLVAEEVRDTAIEGTMEVRKIGESVPEKASEPVQQVQQLQQAQIDLIREQDNLLDSLSGSISRVKEMSTSIGSEIATQTETLHSLDDSKSKAKKSSGLFGRNDKAEQETDKKSSGFGSFFTNLFSSSSSPSAPPTPAQHSASVVSAHSYRTPPPSSYSTPAPAPAPAPSRTYNNLSDCCQIDPVFMSEPVNVDDWDKDEDERFHLFEGFTFHHETPAPSSLNPKRTLASLFGDDNDDNLFAASKSAPARGASSSVSNSALELKSSLFDDDDKSAPAPSSKLASLFDDDKPAPKSAPAPAPTRVDPNTRPLDTFIVLQKAAGNWTQSKAFLLAIGKTQNEIAAVFGVVGADGWESDVIATVLAVVFLETKFADAVDEWSLLRNKAIRWATKELAHHHSPHSIDHYIQLARNNISIS